VGTGGAAPVADPNLDGPFAITEIDAVAMVPETGHQVPIHCAYPTAGPAPGPFPVVLFGKGFQMPVTQYFNYLRRLATFGYVALTVDFPLDVFAPSHVQCAKDMIGGLHWAATQPQLQANVNHAGATGHSLGGKLSLLTATLDPRIKASITLDPVDSAVNCAPQECPDVSSLVPSLGIPTGFLGETLDGASCAPTADNYATFYASANAPSFSVTVLGASHTSFLDDVFACGPPCSFCFPASVPNAQVTAMSRAYVVAFYERHLRNNAGYDAYLTGAEAQARYVTTGQATIESK
jgi:dienelactone hydrolase